MVFRYYLVGYSMKPSCNTTYRGCFQVSQPETIRVLSHWFTKRRRSDMERYFLSPQMQRPNLKGCLRKALRLNHS